MKYLKEIFRGILIGVAGIVPGVSGGTLAVSMGVYDKIIHALTHLTSETRESIKTLFPYGLGMIAGMGGLAFIIEVLFVKLPLATSLTFIGLILGGFPTLKQKADLGRTGIKGYCTMVVIFCVMLIITISGGDREGVPGLSEAFLAGEGNQISVILCLLSSGFIYAAAMVIPGVSGTMLLMMMGYYQPILASVNRFQIGLFTFNPEQIMVEQKILLPCGAGLLAGIFLCAKMVEALLKEHESITYCGILGLVLSSPVVILWGIPISETNLIEIVSGIICMAFSAFLVQKLG
ncbi:DUF368 domain-containing protein [Lachnoclostridium edouardi]|uniref:DUF368 domain-containing protein n=1 Tax=Lachnoclostridium edouardi TaxID=1926283 RepID=UPI000C7BD555|nr:DUF368 domain-containing protein [Lachnoclostridium edouardi]